MSGRRFAAAVGAVALCALARASVPSAMDRTGARAESGGTEGLRAQLGAERAKLLAGSRTRVGAVLNLRAPEGEDDS
ncbi:MAG: hypothetical protein ACYS9X_24085, partial [Planctomycetota bacterium]